MGSTIRRGRNLTVRRRDLIAKKWGISREDMEEWALQSHQRARAAITDGRFERETVSLGQCVVDECPRETSMEQMAALPALRDGSLLTAAVASQICDGASAA